MGWVREFFDKISIIKFQNFQSLVINILVAVILLAAGFVVGNFISRILKIISERAKLEREIKSSFIDLIIMVIKWTIFVIFINLALVQLDIPELTSWLVSVLSFIPAFTGAILLIGVGFAIAIYLKRVIEDSEIEGHEFLSKVFFYFVMYVFLFFAIKTALINQERWIVGYVLLIFTGVVAIGFVYWNIKKSKEKA